MNYLIAKALEEWYAATGQQAESVDRLVSITDASSNLYVAGGQLNQYGKYDLLFTKYDDTGYELWPTTFNLPDSTGNVIAADIALDNSGNVIVAGTVYNGPSNNYDALTIKFNSSGAKQWHKTYNGAGSFYDGGTYIYIDSGDNVYITGGTASLSTSMDMLCVKYNSSGGQNWAQTVDGFGLYDVGSFLFPRAGSLFILTGVVQKKIAVEKAFGLPSMVAVLISVESLVRVVVNLPPPLPLMLRTMFTLLGILSPAIFHWNKPAAHILMTTHLSIWPGTGVLS